jgi:hypothetical protein
MSLGSGTSSEALVGGTDPEHSQASDVGSHMADEAARRAYQRERQEGHIPSEVGPRSTPGRLRTLTVLCVLTALGLLAVAWTYVDQARDGLGVVGEGQGPRALASADLYQALADMDTQVAGIVLVDDVGENNAGVEREELLATYDERRTDASAALLQAGQLAMGDDEAERTVAEALDTLGRYEQLAGEVVLLSEQNGDAAEQPFGTDTDADVVELYREASGLMSEELLPKAYNIALESGSVVRATEEETRGELTRGIALVVLTGLLLVGSLVLLQVYLRIKFRRRFSPPIAAAGVVALLLALGAANGLGTASEGLAEAKEDEFDSAMAVAQARAIGANAHGDQARFLLDAERADTYEQLYLERAQSVVFVPGGSIEDYGDAAEAVIGDLTGQDGVDEAVLTEAHEELDQGLLGLLGEEAEQEGNGTAGEAAVHGALAAYTELLAADGRMRAESDDQQQAVRELLSGEDSVAAAHARYDEAAAEIAVIHREEFGATVEEVGDGLTPWNWLLPLGTALVIGLVIAGVRPRIAEYTGNR